MGILRRTFLIGLGLAGGGLLVGGYVASREWDNPLLAEGELPDGGVALTPFVSVDEESNVTIYVPRAEMGQGVTTTLAALVAEEMGLALSDVSVSHGPASGAYYNAAMLREGGPFSFLNERLVARSVRSAFGAGAYLLGLQVTGGSSSVRDAFDKMRLAGATAALALRRAAAASLEVGERDVRPSGRTFVHDASGRTVTFGAVAARASEAPLPDEVALVPREEWRLLGKSQPRVDTLAKVDGTAVFGIDVDLPDMLHATVVMPPPLAPALVAADVEGARAMPGVVEVAPLDWRGLSGFGVIASDTWRAFEAARALDARWEGTADTETIIRDIHAALNGTGDALTDRGNVDAAAIGVDPDRIFEVEYSAPFLAHATMEPMNATARLDGAKLDVWVGTQAPTLVKAACAEAVGIDATDVRVHSTLLGGGFGRRGEVDFAVYAALLSRFTKGRPVKVTWTREHDITRDMYRPAAAARYRAVLGDPEDESRMIVSLQATIASPSPMESMMGRLYPSLPTGGPDRLITEGAFDQPYEIQNKRVIGVKAPQSLPVGFWRAVGNSYNAFFHETFIDECAVRSGHDPLEYRLRLAAPYAPATGALRRVGEMADWGADRPRTAKGVAFCLSFGAWVAQVIEVEDRDGTIAVTRAWCAVDMGIALDPAIVAAQMRGGMVFGLSAAIGQRITVVDGQVAETNFDGFDALRIGQAPRIEVAILETAEKMAGAGEPGVPPAAPALGNAIFALTGKRLRAMPFADEVEFVGW